MAPVHVMLGESTSHRVVDVCRRLGWARMWVYRNIRPIEGERWGFDNGVFKLWDRKAGPFRREQFDGDGYMRRVERAQRAGTPWLAVVPDLPAAGLGSLELSLEWLPRMPQEWPLYLAVQDGMTPADVRDVLAPFTGIFVGGSTEFKATLPTWAAFARETGKRIHYARCTSPKRLYWAQSMGIDSVDSSQPLWSWKALQAFEHASRQEGLFA